MNKRSGISLIVLVVTIVVLLILISVGFITIDKNIDNAAISGFMNDLKDVEDVSAAYIIENGTSIFEELSYEEVLQLLENDAEESFINELILNKDSEVKNFYKINLSDVGVKKSTRGNGAGGENDIYVLTEDSLHAYYLKGILVNDVYYFSISSKISDL